MTALLVEWRSLAKAQESLRIPVRAAAFLAVPAVKVAIPNAHTFWGVVVTYGAPTLFVPPR